MRGGYRQTLNTFPGSVVTPRVALPGDIANGVEVLYRTILLLDKKLGAKPTA
jgi:hypothetical protein